MRAALIVSSLLVVSGCPGGPDASDDPGETDAGETDAPADTDDTDGADTDDANPTVAARYVYAASDDPPHSGILNSTMVLFAAPYDADGSPDFGAAVRLSAGYVDGYDAYGENHLRPQVSPDGRFAAWIDQDTHELYLGPVDGSEAPWVVGSWPEVLAWSPTSDALAFVDAELQIAAVDGEVHGCGYLEGYVSVIPDMPLTWAPDGAAVHVSTSYQDEAEDWYAHHFVCEAAGGTAVDLTPEAGDFSFAFGPGGRVAYAAGGKVYVDDAAGGDATEVGTGLSVQSSVDGSRLVWIDGNMDDGGVPTTAPWDGSSAGTPVGEATAARAFDPVWFRPDGGAIAFMEGEDLRVAAFDGSIDHVVYTGAVLTGTEGLEPSWSPDGQRVAFVDTDAYTLHVARAHSEDSGLLVCSDDCTGGYFWLDDRELLYFGQSTFEVWTPPAVTRGDTDASLRDLYHRNRPEGLAVGNVSREEGRLTVVFVPPEDIVGKMLILGFRRVKVDGEEVWGLTIVYEQEYIDPVTKKFLE